MVLPSAALFHSVLGGSGGVWMVLATITAPLLLHRTADSDNPFSGQGPPTYHPRNLSLFNISLMISMDILLYCAAPLLSPDRTADSDDPSRGLHTPTSTLMFQPAPHYEHQKSYFTCLPLSWTGMLTATTHSVVWTSPPTTLITYLHTNYLS